MNEVVEKLAEELGITAAEANALLSDEERNEIAELNGEEPVKTATQAVTDNPPVKAPVVSKEDTERLQQEGKETAREIENARSASDSVARSVLLKRAEELATKPAHAAVFLDGFAAGLVDCGVKETIAVTRKAEAKAVLDAYSKTIADNLTDARKALVEFTGGYHEFIVKCREIRGVQAGRGRKLQAGPKSKLNESETERAKDLIHGMSVGQAMEASVVLGNQVLRMQDGELATIRLVANVYLQPLMVSKDVGIRKWATDSHERAIQILTAADKAKPQQDAHDNTAHGIIPVPQPAVEQSIAA